MVIGITAGIGSGKTTVINYIKERINAKIILTDDVAKELMKPENISYKLIVSNFGTEILDDNNFIDRNKLSKIVFNNKENLEKLNSFTHPYVIEYTKNFIKENKNDLIIIESALLLDTSIKDLCDEIWFIKVDKNIRIKRLIEGRDYTREKIEAVMNNQKNDEFYERNSNIIINNNSLEEMKTNVNNNLNRILGGIFNA